jgi:hypothetical protein
MVEHRNFSFRMGAPGCAEKLTRDAMAAFAFSAWPEIMPGSRLAWHNLPGPQRGSRKMQLAKEAIVLGLSTNRLEPMLQCWQQDAGLRFDHVLPVRRGLRLERQRLIPCADCRSCYWC